MAPANKKGRQASPSAAAKGKLPVYQFESQEEYDSFIKWMRTGGKSDASDLKSPAPKQSNAHEPFCPYPEFNGRELYVGFIAYKSNHPAITGNHVGLAFDYGYARMQWSQISNDGFIGHARNLMAQRFLESGATWLLFWDEDTIMPIGRRAWLHTHAGVPEDYPQKLAETHIVNKLLSRNQPLIGATYFGRKPGSLPTNSLLNDGEYLKAVAQMDDRIFPCDWTGTGAMLIHRSVFDKIKAKFPELEESAGTGSPFGYFDQIKGWGEDVSFCMRARQADVQPHVDSLCQALHVGSWAFGLHTSKLRNVL